MRDPDGRSCHGVLKGPGKGPERLQGPFVILLVQSISISMNTVGQLQCTTIDIILFFF